MKSNLNGPYFHVYRGKRWTRRYGSKGKWHYGVGYGLSLGVSRADYACGYHQIDCGSLMHTKNQPENVCLVCLSAVRAARKERTR